MVSGEVIPIGESLDVEHWVKQVTAPVLFLNALVKVLNVDEYKLDVNINHSSKVGVVIEIGPSTVLYRMAKSWREPSISDRDPVWVTLSKILRKIKDIWYQILRIRSMIFKSHLEEKVWLQVIWAQFF